MVLIGSESPEHQNLKFKTFKQSSNGESNAIFSSGTNLGGLNRRNTGNALNSSTN
jgi:hypothetical protein